MAREQNGAGGADEPPIEVNVTDRRSVANLDGDDSSAEPDATAACEATTDGEEDLQAQVARLDARRQDLLNRLTRVQADFANYRRRTSEESQEIARFANQAMAFELLSVLDAFERAFGSVPNELRLLTWIDGIALIQAQLRRVLESAGVTPIECQVGDPIDVAIHEVVMTDGDAATAVVAEMQRGYRMHDRVIRPALVKAGPKPATDEAPGADAGQDAPPPAAASGAA